jgi:hypothetical protein
VWSGGPDYPEILITDGKLLDVDNVDVDSVEKRFSNLFQVGTTFINQNVLRTALLLTALKANCLRFSTIVCDMQFALIVFFLSFFVLMSILRGPQGQNPRTTV